MTDQTTGISAPQGNREAPVSLTMQEFADQVRSMLKEQGNPGFDSLRRIYWDGRQKAESSGRPYTYEDLYYDIKASLPADQRGFIVKELEQPSAMASPVAATPSMPATEAPPNTRPQRAGASAARLGSDAPASAKELGQALWEGVNEPLLGALRKPLAGGTEYLAEKALKGIDDPKTREFAIGLARGIADAGVDLSTPLNIGLLYATGGLGKLATSASRFRKAAKLLSVITGGAFSLNMLKEAIPEAVEAYRLAEKGDYRGSGQEAARFVVDSLFGIGAARHARRVARIPTKGYTVSASGPPPAAPPAGPSGAPPAGPSAAPPTGPSAAPPAGPTAGAPLGEGVRPVSSGGLGSAARVSAEGAPAAGSSLPPDLLRKAIKGLLAARESDPTIKGSPSLLARTAGLYKPGTAAPDIARGRILRDQLVSEGLLDMRTGEPTGRAFTYRLSPDAADILGLITRTGTRKVTPNVLANAMNWLKGNKPDVERATAAFSELVREGLLGMDGRVIAKPPSAPPAATPAPPLSVKVTSAAPEVPPPRRRPVSGRRTTTPATAPKGERAGAAESPPAPATALPSTPPAAEAAPPAAPSGAPEGTAPQHTASRVAPGAMTKGAEGLAAEMPVPARRRRQSFTSWLKENFEPGPEQTYKPNWPEATVGGVSMPEARAMFERAPIASAPETPSRATVVAEQKPKPPATAPPEAAKSEAMRSAGLLEGASYVATEDIPRIGLRKGETYRFSGKAGKVFILHRPDGSILDLSSNELASVARVLSPAQGPSPGGAPATPTPKPVPESAGGTKGRATAEKVSAADAEKRSIENLQATPVAKGETARAKPKQAGKAKGTERSAQPKGAPVAAPAQLETPPAPRGKSKTATPARPETEPLKKEEAAAPRSTPVAPTGGLTIGAEYVAGQSRPAEGVFSDEVYRYLGRSGKNALFRTSGGSLLSMEATDAELARTFRPREAAAVPQEKSAPVAPGGSATEAAPEAPSAGVQPTPAASSAGQKPKRQKAVAQPTAAPPKSAVSAAGNKPADIGRLMENHPELREVLGLDHAQWVNRHFRVVPPGQPGATYSYVLKSDPNFVLTSRELAEVYQRAKLAPIMTAPVAQVPRQEAPPTPRKAVSPEAKPPAESAGIEKPVPTATERRVPTGTAAAKGAKPTEGVSEQLPDKTSILHSRLKSELGSLPEFRRLPYEGIEAYKARLFDVVRKRGKPVGYRLKGTDLVLGEDMVQAAFLGAVTQGKFLPERPRPPRVGESKQDWLRRIAERTANGYRDTLNRVEFSERDADSIYRRVTGSDVEREAYGDLDSLIEMARPAPAPSAPSAPRPAPEVKRIENPPSLLDLPQPPRTGEPFEKWLNRIAKEGPEGKFSDKITNADFTVDEAKAFYEATKDIPGAGERWERIYKDGGLWGLRENNIKAIVGEAGFRVVVRRPIGFDESGNMAYEVTPYNPQEPPVTYEQARAQAEKLNLRGGRGSEYDVEWVGETAGKEAKGAPAAAEEFGPPEHLLTNPLRERGWKQLKRRSRYEIAEESEDVSGKPRGVLTLREQWTRTDKKTGIPVHLTLFPESGRWVKYIFDPRSGARKVLGRGSNLLSLANSENLKLDFGAAEAQTAGGGAIAGGVKPEAPPATRAKKSIASEPVISNKRILPLAVKYDLPVTDTRVKAIANKPVREVVSMADELMARAADPSLSPMEAERMRTYASFYLEAAGEEPIPGVLDVIRRRTIRRQEEREQRRYKGESEAVLRQQGLEGLEIGRPYILREPAGPFKAGTIVLIERVSPTKVWLRDASGKVVAIEQPPAEVAAKLAGAGFAKPTGKEKAGAPAAPAAVEQPPPARKRERVKKAVQKFLKEESGEDDIGRVLEVASSVGSALKRGIKKALGPRGEGEEGAEPRRSPGYSRISEALKRGEELRQAQQPETAPPARKRTPRAVLKEPRIKETAWVSPSGEIRWFEWGPMSTHEHIALPLLREYYKDVRVSPRDTKAAYQNMLARGHVALHRDVITADKNAVDTEGFMVATYRALNAARGGPIYVHIRGTGYAQVQPESIGDFLVDPIDWIKRNGIGRARETGASGRSSGPTEKEFNISSSRRPVEAMGPWLSESPPPVRSRVTVASAPAYA